MEKRYKNKCKCLKCGTVIESKHRHDFIQCECKSIFTDGGQDYQRRGSPDGHPDQWIENILEEID